jgi:hypothetical protein
MPTEESLNLLNQKPGNVKNALVQKLSRQWPLTAKQLSNALPREFGLNITYQAVHKALNELEKENVVQKGKTGYQLDERWIHDVLQISQSIAQNYERNEPLDFDKEIIQLHFKNWISAGRFVAFDFKEQAPNPENKPIVGYFTHSWPVNTVSIEETQRVLENAKKTRKSPTSTKRPKMPPSSNKKSTLSSWTST